MFMEITPQYWKHYLDQKDKCTPLETSRLNRPENVLKLAEAEQQATAKNEIGICQNALISIIQPGLSPKRMKEWRHWKAIKKENEELDKQLREILGDDYDKVSPP